MSNVLGNNTSAIESKDSRKVNTIKLVLSILLATAEAMINSVVVTAKEISEGNFAVTISYLTISDYLVSQKNDTEVSLVELFKNSEKAHVLASALNEMNSVSFAKEDGSPMEMYSAGIKIRELKVGKVGTGLFYKTCTWYSESSKTILVQADTAASAEAIEFIQAREQLEAELKARLAAQVK